MTMYKLDHDPLSQLTKDLDQLLASPTPLKKIERKKREQQVTSLIDRIEELKRFYTLKIGHPVTNGHKLGTIVDLGFSPGGMPQVWVKWDNGLTIAETVNTLKPEPKLKDLKIGDAVTYNHRTYKIKEFKGNGLILTENGQTITDFTPNYWDNNYTHFTLFELKWRYQFEADHYWIEGIDYSLAVDIPLDSIPHFPSPQAFLKHWLNSDGKSHLTAIKQSKSQEKDPNLTALSHSAQKNELSQNSTGDIESNQKNLEKDVNNPLDNVEAQKNSEMSQVSEQINPDVLLSELSDEEQRDRLYLERKVERAFYEAGKALMEIRDRRLYRSTHKSFEEYCRERFGFKRRHPYQLINAAQVVENLLDSNLVHSSTNRAQTETDQMCANRTQTEMRTNRAQILPTSEWQVRPLTKLDPSQQREVWQEAVQVAGGKVPSSRIVKDIVTRIRQKTPVPNPYRVGEVVTILVKENLELRGKGGCWGIITEVHEFSCTLRLWDGEYTLQIQHLQEMPLSPEQRDEMKQISDRVFSLYDPNLEDTAKSLLASLGKINRPYLTLLEEQLLTVLEQSN